MVTLVAISRPYAESRTLVARVQERRRKDSPKVTTWHGIGYTDGMQRNRRPRNIMGVSHPLFKRSTQTSAQGHCAWGLRPQT